MKVKKMGEGLLGDLGSIGKDLAKESAKALIPLARDYAKSAVQKKLDGSGLYASNFNMSPSQTRSIKTGGSITLKMPMLTEAGKHKLLLSPKMLKRVERAFAKNKGIRLKRELIEDIQDQSGGSIFSQVVSALAPVVIDKLANYASKQLGDGLYAGGDIIQTGSPFSKLTSPAMNPYKETESPFSGYKPLAKRRKVA